MILGASHSTAPSRLDRLVVLSRAITQKKGRTEAFSLLHIQDRVRILASLKLSQFDWTTISTKGLKGRAEEQIAKMIRELRGHLIAKKDLNETIIKFPRVLLTEILHMAGENPGNIGTVCKRFYEAQNESFRALLHGFSCDSRMMHATCQLSVRLVKQMDAGNLKKNVREIYCHILRSANEAGIMEALKEKRRRGSSPLDLGAMAEEIQRIKDCDLVKVFERLKAILIGLDFLDWQGNSMEAAQVREWMRLRPEVLAHVDHLELENLGLRTLPPEIGLLVNLRLLGLCGNHLRKLPKEFYQLHHLDTLDLSHNCFETLPGEFGQLSSLLILDLSQNEFAELFLDVGRLTLLGSLCLSRNRLKKLPSGIGCLTALFDLDLSFNELERLPTSLGDLSQLNYLNLSHNRLKDLTFKMGKLPLKELNLSLNPLRQLPWEFETSNPLKIPLSKECFSHFLIHCYTTFTIRVREAPLCLRVAYFKCFEQLLLKALKKKNKEPLQDRFLTELKSIKDESMRSLFEGVLQEASINLLKDMSVLCCDRKIERMLFFAKELPRTIRHRMYAFTALLEKKKGVKADTFQIARARFLDARKINWSLRYRILQFTLLETLVEFYKHQRNDRFFAKIAAQFHSLDAAIKRTIYRIFLERERKAGRTLLIQDINSPGFGVQFKAGFDKTHVEAIEVLLRAVRKDSKKTL